MKLAAALLLLAAGVATPDIRYFRYERPVLNAPRQPAQTCLVVDAGLLAHAAPQLADLRLYRDHTEVPYVVQLAAPAQPPEQPTAPLNLGLRGGQTVFDATMPEGSYSDIELAVTGHDFIATVMVSGSRTKTGLPATRLGSYTIFDLTGQKLGRSTVLHLPQSNFSYLHFRIAGPLLPESITGISVVRLPAGQPKFVTVAETARVTQKEQSSVYEFTVPAHVPVNRIAFAPGASPANFSRDVRITATPIAQAMAAESNEPQSVSSYGSLLRLHSVRGGHRIDEERLAISSPRADFDTPAKWTVTVMNGDDAPLQIDSVRLQMLQRNLCFEAAAAARYTLYYGDPALSAPRYDYAKLFALQPDAAQATAGPEQLNPDYRARPDERPFTEKHPALLWLALGLVILILAAIAMRSAKPTESTPQ